MRTPEQELLLLCASPVKTDPRDSRIRELLDSRVDWTRLQELAEWHRLTPVLYWELNAIRPEILPPLLADRFHENLRSNVCLTGELLRVLDLLDRQGIDAIPFKGPTLAVAAYRNLALRSFDDLDILVRREDVWRARDLLLHEGYKTSLRLNPIRQPDYLRAYDELVLHRDNGYPLLELHWAFIPPHFPVSLDIEVFRERAEQVWLGNRLVPVLKPEDLLLVLCLHGAKHCWSHLGLIGDVARLMTNQPIDWNSVLPRAREAGIHRMVLLAAALASGLLEAPLAEPVARAIQGDPEVPILAAGIVDALFGKPHDETAILRSGLLHMRMRERLRDRLRYGFRLLTRPGIEDWQMVDLPRPLGFLYSVLRYPRLALKYRSRVP